ncbi:Flp family type IVb pilin [Azospirillum thiophilum]|uniref:Flp family type IVb pilin n=1 Tax=Azospirillum thiophilum TaxID=528244 RepID=UPI0009E19B49|nr:Flp family type IVb pilin [Azospirillum thiophilum]
MSFLSRIRLCLAPLSGTTRAAINDRRGVTALEYGLAAALVALVIIGGAKTFGTNVATMFTGIGTSVSGVSTTIP